MHGNIWEWCWDGYSANYYKEQVVDDPRGPDGAALRVYRGGGWNDFAGYCRSADRDWYRPVFRGNYLGFRLALQVKSGEETVLGVTYTSLPGYQPDRRSPAPPKLAENSPAHAENKASVSASTGKPATPAPANELATRTGQIKLRLIPAGEFKMGSPDGQGDSDEHPQHKVRITRPFYMGAYEVTQAQYQAVTGRNPSDFSSTGGMKNRVAGQSTDQHPVENVSWLDAVKFCNLLSEKEGLKPVYEIQGDTVRVPDWNATGYRLPSEAEWEYACRAGNSAAYSFGDAPNQLGDYAWHDGNSKVNGNGCTYPVGQKRANAFELYDMHGNVWEWCWDRYDENYYKQPLAEDPHGPEGASPRVSRGGCWRSVPANCRSAGRYGFEPAYRHGILGFRLALGQSGG
jgi:formylglycine-generating enzyme required for sulfatase activity